jgi:hypothetical protein
MISMSCLTLLSTQIWALIVLILFTDLRILVKRDWRIEAPTVLGFLAFYWKLMIRYFSFILLCNLCLLVTLRNCHSGWWILWELYAFALISFLLELTIVEIGQSGLFTISVRMESLNVCKTSLHPLIVQLL